MNHYFIIKRYVPNYFAYLNSQTLAKYVQLNQIVASWTVYVLASSFKSVEHALYPSHLQLSNCGGLYKQAWYSQDPLAPIDMLVDAKYKNETAKCQRRIQHPSWPLLAAVQRVYVYPIVAHG